MSHAALLRESGQTIGEDYDLAAAVHGVGDSGVANGTLLVSFAESVLGNDDEALAYARERLLGAMGIEALVDACGVVASFNSVVRIADACGIELDAFKQSTAAAIRAALDR